MLVYFSINLIKVREVCPRTSLTQHKTKCFTFFKGGNIYRSEPTKTFLVTRSLVAIGCLVLRSFQESSLSHFSFFFFLKRMLFDSSPHYSSYVHKYMMSWSYVSTNQNSYLLVDWIDIRAIDHMVSQCACSNECNRTDSF